MARNPIFRGVRAGLLALIATVALAGCRVEVYDGLSQRDANEITALLITSGIDAKRQSVKGGTFAVTVGENDFAQAAQTISRSGLPKPQFATIVDVLSDDRLIASPSKERARLNYAVSQELSRTVSEIEGIVSARVHLATPSNEPLARRDGESSASVAIHHHKGFSTTGFVARIKMLVANAVDGLKYERVSIALFPTTEAAAWPEPDQGADVRFEEPAPKISGSQAKPSLERIVTPATVMESRFDPVIAPILAGVLVVLLLAGHTILTGRRAPAPSRHNPDRDTK